MEKFKQVKLKFKIKYNFKGSFSVAISKKGTGTAKKSGLKEIKKLKNGETLLSNL
jgi:hypothetical protein